MRGHGHGEERLVRGVCPSRLSRRTDPDRRGAAWSCVIEQAKGAVAQFRNVSVDAAFLILPAHARRTQRRLGDIAHAVLTNPDSLDELSDLTPAADDPTAGQADQAAENSQAER